MTSKFDSDGENPGAASDALSGENLSLPATGRMWEQVRNEISLPGHEDSSLSGAKETSEPTAKSAQDSMNWARAYGRYFVVGGIICGLAIPELAALAGPLLAPLLVVSLVLAIIQLDFSRLSSYTSQKTLVCGLLFCLMVLAPTFIALQAKSVLVPYGLPIAIADGMILAAMVPPLLSAPVIAIILNLDALLAFGISLIGHVLAPLTIAVLAEWLIGPEISISLWELAARLSLLIGAGFAIGFILHVLRVPRLITRAGNGVAIVELISVLTLSIIAIALMDGVTVLALTDPHFVMLAFLCGFILNPVLQLFGMALFAAQGVKTALTAGMLSGYRNTGVLIAVLAGSTDPKILTFLAIVQIPTFLMPMVSSSLVRWMRNVGMRTANT